MADKRTSRPPGRPRTSTLQGFSAKIPRELLEQVKRYAARHRQSVSELVKEGLEWRIGEGDPRGLGLPGTERTIPYYDNIETPEEPVLSIDNTVILKELRALVELVNRSIEVRSASEELGITELPEDVQHVVIEAVPAEIPSQPVNEEPAADTPQPTSHVDVFNNTVSPRSAPADIPTEAKQEENRQPEITVSPFDSTRFVLGKLCPRGHEYHETGLSLLRLPKKVCPQCDAEAARRRRQAKRQKKPQETAQ